MTKQRAASVRPRANILLACCFVLPLALAGCGDDAPVTQQTFAPLDYGYLSKLRLNVGTIDVQDHSTPLGGSDLSALAPTPPAQALSQMARERLFAAGTSGTAVFVIDQASIVRGPSGALDGELAVHLDTMSDGGRRTGHAEARVARQHVPGSDGEDQRAALYALTRQMMDDMNVELEFQVRRSLKDWLVTAGAVPTAVEAQPLPGSPLPPSSGAASSSATFDAPAPQAPVPPPLSAPSALPSATPPIVSDDAPPAQVMSPPPGYLQAPPGYAQPVPSTPTYPSPAYPSQNYPSQTYPSQTYPGQAYPSGAYPSQPPQSQPYQQPSYPQPAAPVPYTGTGY